MEHSSQGRDSSIPWIEHEMITLLQKLNWYQGVHTLVQKEDKHFPLYILELFRQRGQRSRSSYRYKESEEGDLSNSLKI